MHIGLFFHIYQPPTQLPDMLGMITRQSYQKILQLLEEFPRARITLNINASLTEQLADAGYTDLLSRMARLAQKGQIEFTGSAAYHPILPDLPRREITRQIKLNDRINQSILGSAYRPKGFFPPELAYEKVVGEAVERLGFRWILLDGSAITDWRKFLQVVYRRKHGKLAVFPREDTLSWRIAFGRIRTKLGLVRAIGADQLSKNQYTILAMDGETFGHHQPRQIKFLREIFRESGRDRRLTFATLSELFGLFRKRKSVSLVPSTWGYTEWDGSRNIWVRWRNPGNPLHQQLNVLRDLAIASVRAGDSQARTLLDKALASDTYWWASGKPFWHPGMVKSGAQLFCEAVAKSENATSEQKSKARYLCYRVIPREFTRLRTKRQRERVMKRKGTE